MSKLILDNNCSLPNNWILTNIKEILFELESGSRPKGGVKNYKIGIPSIGAEHLNNEGYFQFDKIKFIPKTFYNSMNVGHIKKNDILIVKDGATIGKTSFISSLFPYNESAVNEHVFIVRTFNDYISQKYLFYFFKSPFGQQTIKNRITGSAQGGINTSFVNNFPITIPPLNEQKRIVEKIEEFSSLLDNYKKELTVAKKKMSTLISSIFQNALTGSYISNKNQISTVENFSYLENFKNPQEKDLKEITPEDIEKLPIIPSDWLWVRLGKICLIKDVDHKMPKAVNSGIDFVSPKDFNDDGTIDFENTKKISFSDYQKNTKKILPKLGDILFSRYGTLGKAIRVPDRQFGLSYSIAVIRSFFNEINFDWLHFLLQSPFILHQAIKGDQSSTMADLGLITMRNFLIPLPPSDEQKTIVDTSNSYISNLQNQIKQFNQNLKFANYLKLMILKQAFEGKLVSQDPNDESAEILLQKIKQEKEQLKQKEKSKKRKKNGR